MTRVTASAEVSAIGQIEPNSSNRDAASSLTMLTVAKFVRTSVATAADTIGGPILREYLNEISPGRGVNTTPRVNKLLSVTCGGKLTFQLQSGGAIEKSTPCASGRGGPPLMVWGERRM